MGETVWNPLIRAENPIGALCKVFEGNWAEFAYFLRNSARCRQPGYLWVAKDARSLGNNGCFLADRTKSKFLAVFLIMATSSIKFSAIGVLGMGK